MREIAKLDWFPLYVDRLMTDDAWEWPDYKFGWYMKLLIRCARSDRRGYLPKTADLWVLAGARSKRFFDQESAVVLARFETRQIDGLDWIYNRTLLDVLETQTNKVQALEKARDKRSLRASISQSPDVEVVEKPSWISQEIWDGFWEMRAKHKKKPPDTPLARKGIIRDVSELRMRGWDPNDILQNSITNGWVGVFEPRQNENGIGTNKKQQGNRAAIAGALRDLAGEADGRNPV